MKRKFKQQKPKNTRQYQPPNQKEYKRKSSWSDFQSPEIKKLYNSKRWKKLREFVMRSHPLCVLCQRAATELHHIEPAHKNIDLFFEIPNLAPLDKDCHEKVNSAYRRGIEPIVIFPLDKRLNL